MVFGVALGCGAETDPVTGALPAGDGSVLDGSVDGEGDRSPELPPRGREAIEAWLQAGSYRRWLCESTVSAPRLGGNHGWHRICWNRLLMDSGEGPFPPGAAAVKERFTMDGVANGLAVSLKVEVGEGPSTWYWYERGGSAPPLRPAVDGIGVPDCTVCHGLARRDHVYIEPPR